MLTLVLRRAAAQRRLVGSVTALVAVAATLLGVCALLLGPTADRAFSRELQQSSARDVDVDAFVVDVDDDDLLEVRETTAARLRAVLALLDPTITSTATSRPRDLGEDRLGYLAAGDGLGPVSELVDGRWPEPGAGVLETTVPQAAAQALGLELGDRVELGQASGFGGRLEPLTVEVVGTFRPRSTIGWESDLLGGAGADPAYGDGTRTVAAYGPFVVDDEAFLDSGSPVARLRVTGRPDLARADRAAVGAAVAELDGAGGLLTDALADRVQLVRVASQLPATLERLEAQQAAGRAVVLVAVLLAVSLSLAALLLAGRLVAAVRDEERAYLVALGLSRRQQFRTAVAEAFLLAAVAAVVALPAASLLHSWLTRTPGPSAAGLATAPTLTLGAVLAVLVSALALTPALVLGALDPDPTAQATRRRWALVRSGADVTLLAVAAAATYLSWQQLADQPATTAARGDVTLTLAPVVALLASTAVAVRVVPALLRAVARLSQRVPSLVLPLSTQQASRRPHPTTAMVLVAAALGAAMFGLGVRATWERSQVDQADLLVGTDLALTLASPGTPAEVVPGAVPVLSRPVGIGRYVGAPEAPPVLIAFDTRQAGSLLRGRPPAGRSWAQVGHLLDPGAPVAGIEVGDGVTLAGSSTGNPAVTAAVTVLAQDADGRRQTLDAAPLPLDGTARPLAWSSASAAGLSAVAVSVRLDATEPGRRELAPVDVSLTLTLPGTGATAWAAPTQDDSALRDPGVEVQPVAGGTALLLQAEADPARLAVGSDLVATSFKPPDAVPVVVSSALADATGAEVGGDLAGVVDETAVPLRVAAVVPDLPSAPGRAAVLADADTLARGLAAAGRLEQSVDAWWVADPSPETVCALRDLEIGEVVTREQVSAELSRGPLQVVVPVVLVTLVVAAVLLLLAGVALVTGADQRRRSAELTRLRALGLTRPGARGLLLGEHAVFLLPLLVLGALVGAAGALLLAPLMVRSRLGAAPVPDAVAAWPWGAELLLLTVVLAGSALVTAAVVALQVRGSDRAGLRTGEE